MTESPQSQAPVAYDDEIDLLEVLRVLWKDKWLIGGVAFAATIVAIIASIMLPNMYRAEALLAPNDQDGNGMSALAAQYGGLASLAGIDIGGSSLDNVALSIEILKSRKFISEFVNQHDILVPLMAVRGWDSESSRLKINPDKYDVATGKWVRKVSPPKKTIPSAQEAYKEFMDIFSVSEDKQSGLVKIAIEHYSPQVAKQWVDWLVEDLNSWIMRRDVAEAEQAIDYLNKQIAATSLAELQNVFFRLIEEQTKTVMLAKVSPEYMFRTIDPAVSPELKAKPKRVLITILGFVAGGIIGLIIVLIRTALLPRSEKYGLVAK